jgi:hypothetical protein
MIYPPNVEDHIEKAFSFSLLLSFSRGLELSYAIIKYTYIVMNTMRLLLALSSTQEPFQWEVSFHTTQEMPSSTIRMIRKQTSLKKIICLEFLEESKQGT